MFISSRWRRLDNTPRECRQCGATFWVVNGEGARIVCGSDCNRAWRTARNAEAVGKKNPAWKGGVSADLMRYKRRSEARHPEKFRARAIARAAINRGELVRQACEVCGDPRSTTHHPDYSKPLDVQWLCRVHHSAAHGGRGVGREPSTLAFASRPPADEPDARPVPALAAGAGLPIAEARL